MQCDKLSSDKNLEGEEVLLIIQEACSLGFRKLPNEDDYFRGIYWVGGKESKLCKKTGIHCKESRVGVESMACFGNCREL